MSSDSIPARLIQQSKKLPQLPAYYVKESGQWKPTNWSDYEGQVRAAGKALMALGFEPGQTSCILGFNRPEWAIMDLATMAVGGAPAGIYTTCSPAEVAYIINHSEAPVVLLENEDQWKKVEETKGELSTLKHVVMMQGAPAIDDDLVLSWDEFMGKGSEISDADYEARIAALEEGALATLIYTSGTTGPPKGVMLSHGNLTWTANCAKDLADTRPSDRSLSYLPLSHIAEQMFTLHVPITTGSSVYFAESIEKVPENLGEVQPTVFFAVPRIWEKFYAKVSDGLKSATGAKKSIATWAQSVGREVAEHKGRGQALPGSLGLKYKLATKLVFSKLKPRLGLGSARVCVSGAAPVSKEILEFFGGLDVVILEVYGQSEGSGPTSFNQSNRFRYGTVGPALPGCDVKIADDGEILVNGPNVFLGYYKDEAATADTLQEGWLHSGDLGSFDSDGFLSITGRKKDIIITAGGKNITPKNIEGALKNHPLINEAVVIGDRRKFLSALISIDPEAIEPWKQKNGESAAPHESEKLRAEIQKTVDEVNTQFARVEQIKKFTILHRQLEIPKELTPTLKVKRNKVNESFAEQIEAMYADE